MFLVKSQHDNQAHIHFVLTQLHPGFCGFAQIWFNYLSELNTRWWPKISAGNYSRPLVICSARCGHECDLAHNFLHTMENCLVYICYRGCRKLQHLLWLRNAAKNRFDKRLHDTLAWLNMCMCDSLYDNGVSSKQQVWITQPIISYFISIGHCV